MANVSVYERLKVWIRLLRRVWIENQWDLMQKWEITMKIMWTDF